VPQSNIATN